MAVASLPQWPQIGAQFDDGAQAYKRGDNAQAQELDANAIEQFNDMPKEQRDEVLKCADLFRGCYCIKYSDFKHPKRPVEQFIGKIGCQILSKAIQVYCNREIPRSAEVDKWCYVAEHLRKADLATAEAMMKSMPQEQQNLVIQNTLALGRSDPVLNNPSMQKIAEIPTEDNLRYRYMAAAIETYLNLATNASALPLSAPVERAKNTIKYWYRSRKRHKDRAEKRKYDALISTKGEEPLFRVERIFGATKRAELIATVNKLISSIKFPEVHSPEKKYEEMKQRNKALWKGMRTVLETNPHVLPIVVWDRHNELQAMILGSHGKRWFKISFLATAPANLGGHGRYRGAGTAAVESAVRLAARWRKNLVSVLRETIAIPFYEKIGLDQDEIHATQFETIFTKCGGKARPVFTHFGTY